MARVFVSHAGQDLVLAARLHSFLTENGHDVFLTRTSTRIVVGEDWEERLHERLRWADVVVRAVAQRNDNLVTIIVPTQNPDGRDATRRQNEFGFDLNRDWFARTQQETDGKLELLRHYPPQVFIDAHEMGGRQYFFPPNADPIHHEIADEAVDWINRIGEANKAGFGFNGACDDTVTTECYFNYDTYDLFFMGYGDTVPTTGFGAAGMTYEKGSASAVADRVQQQFHTQWSTLGWAAANKREVLDGYFDIWTDALAQGRAGTLEPNEVVQPTNDGPVPGAGPHHPLVLPAARPAARRRPPARRAAAPDGRRGVRGEEGDHGCPPRGSSAGAAPPTSRCPRARTGSRWTSRRSTGSRPSWARTRTSRSRTSTTCRPGATRC